MVQKLTQREKALVTALRVAMAQVEDPESPALRLALQCLEEVHDIRLDESPYEGVVVSMAEYVFAHSMR